MANLRVRSRHANRGWEKKVELVGRAFNTRPVSIDGKTDWLVDGQASIMLDVFGVTGRIDLRCPRGEPRLRRSWTLR